MAARKAGTSGTGRKLRIRKTGNRELISFEGKKALVIGTGISGVGAVHILRASGASVSLLEENVKKTRDEVLSALDEADRADTDVIVGSLSPERYGEFSLAVPSPAVPSDTGVVAGLKEAGVPAELDVYHGDVHAFDMLTPWTKEARAARRKLCAVYEEFMNR